MPLNKETKTEPNMNGATQAKSKSAGAVEYTDCISAEG